MTKPLCIADASALREMSRVVGVDKRSELLAALTKAISKNRLGFPREVIDELNVIARDEPIWAWSVGVKGSLSPFDADITYMRALMGHVYNLGFTSGIESLDGRESCLPAVGCLCLNLDQNDTGFVLATEDFGEVPLRPTMEQIAVSANWSTVDAVGALAHLDLNHLI